MGNMWGIAIVLSNLGNVALAQGDTTAARALQQESLSLRREISDKQGIASSLCNLGNVALAKGDFTEARALSEESLALCQEMEDKTLMAYALLGLGQAVLAENKTEARKHILHSLHLRQEASEKLFQTSSLIGVAGLVLHEGHSQFAAQLLGAVESALKALKATTEPEMKPFHAQTLAKVKQALGEAAFQSAWEEGSQWSLEEAVKRALENSDE
jgi:ATP/maltotriose-dependent transcriptional regulator MalT